MRPVTEAEARVSSPVQCLCFQAFVCGIFSSSSRKVISQGLEPCSRLVFSGFCMWHFLKLIKEGYLPVLQCPSLLYLVNNFSPQTTKNQHDFNSVKDDSGAVPSQLAEQLQLTVFHRSLQINFLPHPVTVN